MCVPPIDEFKASYRVSIWYDKSDFVAMKQEILSLAFSPKLQASASGHDLRGLERYITTESRDYWATKKHKATLTVIREQQRQWSRDISMPQTISDYYIQASKDHVNRALKLAMEDEIEAALIYANPEQSKSTKSCIFNLKTVDQLDKLDPPL